MLAKLHSQQDFLLNFTHSKIPMMSRIDVKTRYVISHKFARNSEPFSDGEFIKECLLGAAGLICPEKKEAFENVPLSWRTVTKKIEDIAENVELQLQHREVS